MNSDKLFYGTLKICTRCVNNSFFCAPGVAVGYTERETEKYLENVLLIRTKHGYYVPVGDLSILDIAYLYLEDEKGIYTSGRSGKLFLDTCTYCEGEVFVDRDSLVPYSEVSQNVSICRLQADMKRETPKTMELKEHNSNSKENN